MFNKDIDSYLLEFLSIPQLATYSILSKTTNNFFKQTKYYPEFSSCNSYLFDSYSLKNISKFGDINLLKKALIEFNPNVISLNKILLEKCKNGQLNCVKLLIEKKADCEIYIDAIQWASDFGHLKIVKFLVMLGIYYKSNHDWSIRWASMHGYWGIVKFLIENGANYMEDGDCAIRWASASGHLEVVKLLIEKGINNIDNAIRWASGNDQLEIVKFLLMNGANYRIYNDAAIEWATEKGYLDIVNLLITKGISKNNIFN